MLSHLLPRKRLTKSQRKTKKVKEKGKKKKHQKKKKRKNRLKLQNKTKYLHQNIPMMKKTPLSMTFKNPTIHIPNNIIEESIIN